MVALQAGIGGTSPLIPPRIVPSHCTCSSPSLIYGGRIVGLCVSRWREPKVRLVVGRCNRGVVQLSVSNRRTMVLGKVEAGLDGVGEIGEEDGQSKDLPKHGGLNTKEKFKASQLKKRVLSGLAVGIAAGTVVLAGGWVFTTAVSAAVFVGAREYFELVRSHGITAGMTPPPRYVSRFCSIICALMPILTLYYGHIDVPASFATFGVVIALLLQRENPRFAQLSSAMFGLFYCGFLPCFWVKLRCNLAVPSLNTGISRVWPILLGGQTHWTVGLVASLISISSVIAADTFAFLGGKAFGRTPLISISPKKTWEGAVVGFIGCIATATILSKILGWPQSFLSLVAFGCLIFFGSLFGDLMESMIKRDAGVKDSGSLIPGHGGVLDRADSYIFTGALAYSFVKVFLPLFGV
ncbi:hypothetical protein Droror1_Dr00025765 [Drosera rotundifolia]